MPGKLTIFGKTQERCIGTLEKAWDKAHEWARRRGMQFEPQKSELIHFTRKRAACTLPVQLATPDGMEPLITVHPAQEGRFLGIWLDRKLTNHGHIVTGGAGPLRQQT